MAEVGQEDVLKALQKMADARTREASILQTLNPKIKFLVDKIAKQRDEVTKLADATGKLTQAEGKVLTARARAKLAALGLAAEQERSVGIMTRLTREKFEEETDAVLKARNRLATGPASRTLREAGILQEVYMNKRRVAWEDEKRGRIAEAKMMQQTGGIGQRAAGVWKGVSNAMMLRGEQAGVAVGDFFGLATGTVAKLSAALGVFAIVGMALNALFKRGAENMKNSIAAGNTLGNTFDQIRGSTATYINQLSSLSIVTSLSRDALNEMAAAIFQEGGVARGMGLDFAASIALIGKTFGVNEQKAVQLATRFGVLARLDPGRTLQTFGRLGLITSELRMPLESLIDPMSQLAEISLRTGEAGADAADSLAMAVRAVEGLKDSGIKFFKTMSGPEAVQFTKKFTDMFTKIDDITLAAITFGKYGSANEMFRKVGEMGTRGRVSGIQDFITRTFGARPDETAQMAIAGIFGGPAMMHDFNLSRGFSKFLMTMNRKLTAEEYLKQSAGFINQRLAQRQDAGTAMAAGEDPTAFVMHSLDRIIDGLSTLTNLVMRWLPYLGRAAAAITFGAGGPLPADIDYGKRTVHSKRPAMGVAVAPR